MASTNKTSHYDLSQFIANDKPTFLGDYNNDMSKIDTGINNAQDSADTANTAATNAQTTAENAATTANTAITNAATADGKAESANNKIGTLANLETVNKTDLVSAINEVNTAATTSEVVNTLAGSQTDKAPSVAAVKEEILGTVLFNNQSGTTSNFSLSSSAANFDYLEFVYCDNSDTTLRGSSGKIENPDGKKVNLSLNSYTGGVAYCKNADLSISGTSVTFLQDFQFYFSNDSNAYIQTGTFIKVIEVIGYKNNTN